MPSPRRFPPPGPSRKTDACFIVRDANGQALAYVYFEEEPGRRSAAQVLTRDEARRIAAKWRSCRSCCACGSGRRWKLRLAVQSALSQRAAASALSSGRVLNAIAASGAALCTALITASNIDRLWGGRRMPAPITTQS